MADRTFFSVLAMSRSTNKSVEKIADKLNLSKDTTQKALDELVRIGILKKDRGEYREVEQFVFRTSEDFPLNLITARRLQNNTAAKHAMESGQKGQRGYFATVSIDRHKLEEIGPIVEDFLKRLCLFVRKPGSEDIYEINLDIFPWSR
jgi:DNA-binding Lrp family transcriptional regulator